MRMGASVAAPPTRPNERWSDFVTDCLTNGQTFRALVIVDDYTRENLAVEMDRSISGLRVRQVVEAVVIERGVREAWSWITMAPSSEGAR